MAGIAIRLRSEEAASILLARNTPRRVMQHRQEGSTISAASTFVSTACLYHTSSDRHEPLGPGFLPMRASQVALPRCQTHGRYSVLGFPRKLCNLAVYSCPSRPLRLILDRPQQTRPARVQLERVRDFAVQLAEKPLPRPRRLPVEVALVFSDNGRSTKCQR